MIFPSSSRNIPCLPPCTSKSVSFKAVSGWVVLDAETMISVATSVGAHVQSCFAIEASVAVAIAAETITTTAEIDAAFE
jgi:hypothetical protein